MNNASKGRCVTVTPSGIVMGYFPVWAGNVKQKRSRGLDKPVVSWFSYRPSLVGGEVAFKGPME